MDYKKIINNVVKSLDPDSVTDVSLLSVEHAGFLGDATFIVADIHYPERDMRVPFVIYSDGEVYMPFDWESILPTTVHNIPTTKWVRFDFV